MTTQKHYYLFTDGIGVFKTEKPTDEKGNFISRSYFKEALNDWLQSGEKYPFGEGEKNNFIAHHILYKPKSYIMGIERHLKSGILISPDRVKILNIVKVDYGVHDNKGLFAYLVPIEEDKPKEESQIELWKSVERIYATKGIIGLTQLFTITRK